MLVLTRKVNQRIQIDDDIVLTITAIKGNRVTVGIEAPKEVAIRRGELSERPTGDPLSEGATQPERQVA